MKKPKVEKLFSGWPKTKFNKNGVRISAEYFTPGRKQFADNLAMFLCMAGMGFGFYAGQQKDDVVAVATGVLVGGFIGYFLGNFLGGFFLKKTDIEFTPELIRVPSGFGFKNYDRKLPHGFDLELHEQAQSEAEREADGQVRLKKYYRDAYHVFMDYLGERVYLADVYNRKKTVALLFRLQGVDQVMGACEPGMIPHTSAGGGDGSKEPASSFGERPPLDDE